MKRILIGWMAALSALLCACSAQTVWETVDGGCVPAEGGAAYAIRIALPQDAANLRGACLPPEAARAVEAALSGTHAEALLHLSERMKKR